MCCAGLLTESRGKAGDATYTRVEQLIESDANRASGRETSSSLAPENEPPLASVQDIIRQVTIAGHYVLCVHAQCQHDC